MSYGNYVQGNVDTNANAYNLVVSGTPSGYTSSAINIGGDTSTTYGVKITSDSTHNAFLDIRGDASNKMSFRYKDNGSGSVSSMLDLTNDSSLTGSSYGATVNGRVNASSYYVGQIDTRAPSQSGVYMGTDGNVGYFNINKGTGTGGFAFNTYNANGSLAQSNLNLLSSGVVQASYYTASGNAADTESVAVGGFDASGNLVRNYAANARFRALESRLTAAESQVNGPVASKVNEVITRLNGLNFFSQLISTISGIQESANPVKNFNVIWSAEAGNTNNVVITSATPSANILNRTSAQVQSYTLPAGSYTFSATAVSRSNDTVTATLVDTNNNVITTISNNLPPWSSTVGPFTGSFTLNAQTDVHIKYNNNYYMDNTNVTASFVLQ